MKTLSALFIPVEIKAREFVAKILFACFAADRGYDVALGKREALYQNVLPAARPGLIVEHDVTAAHLTSFLDLGRLGHTIVSWDEEAITQPSGDWYVSRRVCPEVVEMTSAHLAWGHEQAGWIAKAYPQLATKLVVTGNPRVDLLRPKFSTYFQDEADEYRRRYGRYILINSNFNRVNLFHGEREKFISSVAKSAGLSAEWTEYYRGFVDHSAATFHAYIELLPRLSAQFPDRQIVVRPHPAENSEPWHRAASGLSNVHVIYEGTANGWIIGSSALVHSGCTTAVEAAVLGVPVIEYVPIDGARFCLPLPRLVSEQAMSAEQLFDRLRAILDGARPAESAANPDHPLHSHIFGLNGQYASENVLDYLSGVQPGHGDLLFRALKRARFLARRCIGQPKRPETSGVRYSRHKFPDTTVEEVQDIALRLGRASGRFGNVIVRELSRNCFRLSRART